MRLFAAYNEQFCKQRIYFIQLGRLLSGSKKCFSLLVTREIPPILYRREGNQPWLNLIRAVAVARVWEYRKWFLPDFHKLQIIINLKNIIWFTGFWNVLPTLNKMWQQKEPDQNVSTYHKLTYTSLYESERKAKRLILN